MKPNDDNGKLPPSERPVRVLLLSGSERRQCRVSWPGPPHVQDGPQALPCSRPLLGAHVFEASAWNSANTCRGGPYGRGPAVTVHTSARGVCTRFLARRPPCSRNRRHSNTL